MAIPTFPVTGDDAANSLLVTDPLALLIGMLLDQQVPMEWAFRSPSVLKQRLGLRFDSRSIAAMEPEELVAVFCEKPALHRYPAAMARRVHALCVHLVERYEGDAARIWDDARSGEELFDRLHDLPGFGLEKSRIFLALLAKRLGHQPAGWKERAGPFADDTPRSVADVDSAESLARVREWKKEQKARGKSKAD